MEVRDGYKQTEVGVIPKDWKCKSIFEVSNVKSGKRLPLGNLLVVNQTPYPYIRVADMINGTILLKDIKYVPVDVFLAIKNYRIYQEDIFISVVGTLGIIGKVPQELNGANLTENADKLTNIQIVQDYLMYLLMSSLIQNTIEVERTLGAQPKLALTRIRSFKIPIPPTKTEQTAIAKALSDVDALIAQLEKLITKKRQIKQGAMQTLLNPFDDNGELKCGWKLTPLPQIIWYQEGPGLRNWQFTEKGIKVINVTNLTYSGVLDLDKTDRYISISEFENMYKYFLIDSGDFVMASSGNSYCKSSVVREQDLPLLMNTSVIRFKPLRNLSKSYMVTYLKSKWFKDQIDLLITGGSQPNFGPFHLDQIIISIPPTVDDQVIIATTLSDIDTEISTLESKLTKTQQLKQGMMQSLLTGQIRLVNH